MTTTYECRRCSLPIVVMTIHDELVFRTRGPKLIEELLRKTCDEHDVSVPRR